MFWKLLHPILLDIADKINKHGTWQPYSFLIDNYCLCDCPKDHRSAFEVILTCDKTLKIYCQVAKTPVQFSLASRMGWLLNIYRFVLISVMTFSRINSIQKKNQKIHTRKLSNIQNAAVKLVLFKKNHKVPPQFPWFCFLVLVVCCMTRLLCKIGLQYWMTTAQLKQNQSI